jgi:hypothetical protein
MPLIAFRLSCPLGFLTDQRKAKKITLSVLCVSAVNYSQFQNSNFLARNASRYFPQYSSLPTSASAAMMLAIIF